MRTPTSKGQTAFEYILVIIVAIVIVASVYVFLVGETTGTEQTTGNQTDASLCYMHECLWNATAGSWDAGPCSSGVAAAVCGSNPHCEDDGFCMPS